MNVEEIIKKGSVEARVNISGMWQRITFNVSKKKAGNLEYYCLTTKKQVGAGELVRLANELGMPVESPAGSAFPNGKMAKDFSTSLFEGEHENKA